MSVEKPCGICGDPFTTKRPKYDRYCGKKECRSEVARRAYLAKKQGQPWKKLKPCPVCKIAFMPKRANQIYCVKECKDLAAKQAQKQRTKEKREQAEKKDEWVERPFVPTKNRGTVSATGGAVYTLSDRQAMVVRMAAEWDKIDKCDRRAIKAHGWRCFNYGLRYMSERAFRRAQTIPQAGAGTPTGAGSR